MSNRTLKAPFCCCCVFAAFALMSVSRAAEPPKPIPVGLDAYRMWERWPDQRIGMRAYMRSTYDRAGGNEGADASHFLYQLAGDFNVTLDVEGQHPSARKDLKVAAVTAQCGKFHPVAFCYKSAHGTRPLNETPVLD